MTTYATFNQKKIHKEYGYKSIGIFTFWSLLVREDPSK